ncbi:MAG: ABC transporter substrate-binding protein [Anaerolineae bacterium]|nr:ABC transporter substrate-binding protein [Anaerolineae bacterium]
MAVNLRLLLLFCLFGWLAACEQSKQPIKIGILNTSLFTEDSVSGFRDGMTELGYIEGETIIYLYAGVIEEPEALAQEAQRLVAQEVDLIFAASTPATQAGKAATADTDIPIVFDAIIDPVSAGFVENRQRPGGQITGVSVGELGSQVLQKNIEWLINIAPQTQKIYAVYDADQPPVFVEPALVSLAEAEHLLSVDIEIVAVADTQDVQTLIDNLDQADGLFAFNAPSAFDMLVAASLDKHIPLGVQSQIGVQQGALFTYLPDFTESGKQAARLADEILQGQNPAEIPVEFPQLYLFINLNTAETIGLDISEDVLESAYRLFR